MEGRKEILEYQKIRAQIIGFKITFTSAVIAIIVASSSNINLNILIIPAFAAICFDLLISSYTFDIRRVGYYCKNYLEPQLRKKDKIPESILMWEQFMSVKRFQQKFLVFGNLGITLLACIPGIAILISDFLWYKSIPLLMVIVGLFCYDLHIHLLPNKFRNETQKK